MRVELENKFEVGDIIKYGRYICTIIEVRYIERLRMFDYLLEFDDEERRWISEDDIDD